MSRWSWWSWCMKLCVVVSNIFYFHPYLGKIPILTNIFHMGWNHQPELMKPANSLGWLQNWLANNFPFEIGMLEKWVPYWCSTLPTPCCPWRTTLIETYPKHLRMIGVSGCASSHFSWLAGDGPTIPCDDIYLKKGVCFLPCKYLSIMQSYVSDVRNIASQPHEYSSPTKSKIQALRIDRIGSPTYKDHPLRPVFVWPSGLSWLASCYHYGLLVHDIPWFSVRSSPGDGSRKSAANHVRLVGQAAFTMALPRFLVYTVYDVYIYIYKYIYLVMMWIFWSIYIAP